MMKVLERDKRKRYAAGTLVVATATFYAEKPQVSAYSFSLM